MLMPGCFQKPWRNWAELGSADAHRTSESIQKEAKGTKGSFPFLTSSKTAADGKLPWSCCQPALPAGRNWPKQALFKEIKHSR